MNNDKYLLCTCRLPGAQGNVSISSIYNFKSYFYYFNQYYWIVICCIGNIGPAGPVGSTGQPGNILSIVKSVTFFTYLFFFTCLLIKVHLAQLAPEELEERYIT